MMAFVAVHPLVSSTQGLCPWVEVIRGVNAITAESCLQLLLTQPRRCGSNTQMSLSRCHVIHRLKFLKRGMADFYRFLSFYIEWVSPS